MSQKELTHDCYKKLYKEKIRAQKRNDIDYLKELHNEYPELFDKRFLFQMLIEEFERAGEKIPESLYKILKEGVDKGVISH